MTIEIGHIRWSRLVEAVRSLDENTTDSLLEPPLKHSRVDDAAFPCVHFFSALAADQSEQQRIGRLLAKHIQPPGEAAAVLYIECDEKQNVVSFSFSDFSSSSTTASAVAGISFPIPSTVTVGNVTLPVFREDRATHEAQRFSHDETAQDTHTALATLTSRTAARKTLASAKILVVGAGGIGCELLKSVVLAGALSITVVDLDTIDATNLNRQFLFRQRHIDAPKSHVAVEIIKERTTSLAGDTSSRLLPSSLQVPCMNALCVNVKDASPMDHAFYTQYDIVLNGLDNMSARKHVNRMCVAAKVPLIESGTMGFNGQVQPILPHSSECYDCRARPSDRPSYAVCTIHARPTSMVHCVHYAKELYERLATTATASVSTETAKGQHQQLSEMDFAKEFVVDALRDMTTTDELSVALNLFQLLFVTKVEQLLALKRDTPWPTAPPLVLQAVDRSCADIAAASALESQLLTADGRVPTLHENTVLFLHALRLLLSTRWNVNLVTNSDSVATFDKQDDLAVLFVSTAANLRATCFHIPTQRLEELRSVAGHIVPAIASSNAIVAACIASQALTLLSSAAKVDSSSDTARRALRFAFLRKMPLVRRAAIQSKNDVDMKQKLQRQRLLLHTSPLDIRNPDCLVCRDSSTAIVHHISVNINLYTVGSFVDVVLRGHYAMASPCLSAGPRVLFEHEEFETLRQRQLLDFVAASSNHHLGGGSTTTTSLTASDLNQSLEWTLLITHDERFSDVAGFSANGVFQGPPEAWESHEALEVAASEL